MDLSQETSFSYSCWSHKMNVVFTGISEHALWWSKSLHSSYSMNHHRVGTCNITAVHSNATSGSNRHSSLGTGRNAVREDGVWLSAVERGGTTCAARQKRESLGQSGVFVHIPRGRRGLPCSPSLWRTFTTLNTQEQINDAMSSNPEGSRLHAKKKKKKGQVMTLPAPC